ncbi:MAG: thermonuclease family protein [Acidilobaceae archaeon]
MYRRRLISGRAYYILYLQWGWLIVVVATLLGTQVAEASEILARTTRVVDGDTIEVEIVEVRKERFKDISGARKVRFADVNAPELSTPEGQRSKEFLASLLAGREVLLDVDDLKVTDRYGRLVAIVFLWHNETHLLNVNALLVERGYAAAQDYENEFSPSSWSLYVAAPSPGRAEAQMPLELIALGALLALLLLIIVSGALRAR